MNSNTFDQITSRESLEKSWKRLLTKTKKSSRNTTGVDGISINDFEKDSKRLLTQLAKDIKLNLFKFSPLKPFLIPKKSGKDRLICVPTVRDRIVQRTLLDYLAKTYKKQIDNEISYGFVPERSVKEAAEDAIKLRNLNPWVFKTDITSFFDQIPRAELESRIKKVIKQSSLHKILFQAVNCEIGYATVKDKQKIIDLGIKVGKGVRQGMPLSPFFANLLLSEFDSQLTKENFKAIRYADDLIFFASNKNECETIAAACKAKLSEIELSIPGIEENSKSSIHSPLEDVDFLGLTIAHSNGKYELKLSKEQRLKIRDEFLKLSSIPELVSRGLRLKDLGLIVFSKKDGYLAAYDCCTNLKELEIDLNNIVQKVLRRIYVKGLNIDLKSIDGVTRQFLSLT